MSELDGFYETATSHADFVREGDILFTVGDVPVIVEEVVRFADGHTAAARVRYIGIAYRSGTSGIESLNDLMTETHVEFEARMRADNFASLGKWPYPRNIAEYTETQVRQFPGVSQDRYADFMDMLARAARQGAL